MHTFARPLLVIGCLSILACHTDTPPAQLPPAAPVQEDPTAPQPPPPGVTTPRYDGVYHETHGGIVQLFRFFPQGTVVTGTDYPNGADSLRVKLTEEVKPDLGKGIHNVPVTYRNDSLLFRTTVLRGYIEYGCKLYPGDSIVVLKASLATGKKALLGYHFVPDGTPLPK